MARGGKETKASLANGSAHYQQHSLCPSPPCLGYGAIATVQFCSEPVPTQPGTTGWTYFRRMWWDLGMTLDRRVIFVFPTDCIPQINSTQRRTIRFNMKSAQMKCKAWTILNCLCFKTLLLHLHVKNMFSFAVVAHFSFKEQLQFTTEKHKVLLR